MHILQRCASEISVQVITRRSQYTVERLNAAAASAQEELREEYESYIKSDGIDISCR